MQATPSSAGVDAGSVTAVHAEPPVVLCASVPAPVADAPTARHVDEDTHATSLKPATPGADPPGIGNSGADPPLELLPDEADEPDEPLDDEALDDEPEDPPPATLAVAPLVPDPVEAAAHAPTPPAATPATSSGINHHRRAAPMRR